MRKSTFAMACLVVLTLFASCSKDPVAPTIDIFGGDEGEVCVTENAQVYSGDEIIVGFMGNGENITKVEVVVSQNGTVLDSYLKTWENPVSDFDITCDFTIEATGAVNIKGTVTDANEQTASKSFDIYYNEKPNAKFVGHYDGDALINGTYDIQVSSMDPIHDNMVDQPFPTILAIEAGDDMNEVLATVTINDQTNTVRGSVDGNQVVFEAINDTYTMHYNYSGMDIPITLDMTYNITGTLNEGMLDLEGNCKGNGEFNMFIFNGTIEMEGTVGGSLTKTE